MEKVTHVRHIGLFTPKPEEEVRFYTEKWGLRIVASQDGATFLRGGGREPYLVAIYSGERRAIHHIGLGLPSRAAVDRAAEELAAQGVTILQQPSPLAEPGGGYGFKILDPDNRCLVLSAEVEELQSLNWQAPAIPQKISHIVLNTADLQGVTSFFTQHLTFRVSDWGDDVMSFLRCNTDHHSISVFKAPFASINHVSFDVGSIDAVLRGGGSLKKAGVKAVWGPGRHGAGDNVFFYFQSPSGYLIEYTCEVEQIRDDAAHQPRVRDLSEDQWGISPGLSEETLGIMLSEPDLGYTRLG